MRPSTLAGVTTLLLLSALLCSAKIVTEEFVLYSEDQPLLWQLSSQEAESSKTLRAGEQADFPVTDSGDIWPEEEESKFAYSEEDVEEGKGEPQINIPAWTEHGSENTLDAKLLRGAQKSSGGLKTQELFRGKVSRAGSLLMDTFVKRVKVAHVLPGMNAVIGEKSPRVEPTFSLKEDSISESKKPSTKASKRVAKGRKLVT